MQKPAVVKVVQHAHVAPIKVDAKIELPLYDREINGEKIERAARPKA